MSVVLISTPHQLHMLISVAMISIELALLLVLGTKLACRLFPQGWLFGAGPPHRCLARSAVFFTLAIMPLQN
jgi:hypothetical protein